MLGGSKFWATEGLVVRNNVVRDNAGAGLWSDTDNRGVLYEGNLVYRNADDGIKHEISYGAVIRNNTCCLNGGAQA
jgi:parallel beta-helix repeat protein